MMMRIMGMIMMMVMRIVVMMMTMVMRKNVGYDVDENDIFQDGESSQECRPNMMTMMMDYGDDDDGDELTHPSKSACDLHQLTWGCGRPVLNEIIRNDEGPIAHL